VLLVDPKAGTLVTRAGPHSLARPYGAIETKVGSFSETFVDKPSETVHLQAVGSVSRGIGELLKHVMAFNEAVDKAKIPYSIMGPNSNTYTGEFPRSVGLESSPDLSAPGFSDTFGRRLPRMGPVAHGWAPSP